MEDPTGVDIVEEKCHRAVTWIDCEVEMNLS